MPVGKILKVAVGGSLLGALTGSSLFYLQQNDWQLHSTGVVRFGRAAIAAAGVVVDYKKTLSALEPGTESYEKEKSKVHWRAAERLREMCCVNRGCFIKVGQHIGALEFLLPKEYVDVFKVLHSDAPKSHIEELKQVIKEDFGKEADEIFSSFDEEPLGTASLAQVHRATLKDGTEVAVKVQHPKVKSHSFVDMKTMDFLVHLVAKIFPDFQFVWLAEETKKNLPKELDFIHEAKNCERVARMLFKFDFLKVPKVYWNLTTERVLTMEYCEGGQVNDKAYIEKHNINVEDVSRKLGKVYSEMIYVHGYIHCDPHPGNVLVRKLPGKETEIILLDHGLYQTLSDDFRLNYCKLWMSMINKDLNGIKKYAERLNTGHLYGLLACMVTGRSWQAITSGIDQFAFTEEEGDLIKDSAANFLPQISEILNKVPRQMLLIFKTNDLLRGIETTLKTRADAGSLITMSKCCIRAIFYNKRKHCTNVWCKIRTSFSEHYFLLKIFLYEWYLWFTGRTTYQIVKSELRDTLKSRRERFIERLKLRFNKFRGIPYEEKKEREVTS